MQTSPHAPQTANITYGSCLNHVTHGAHPINPCCLCFACTKSKPSRCEPQLADLVKSLCSIQMGHGIFPPLTFPSKTQETERRTIATTFKIPSSELFSYNHKDTRSLTSLCSPPCRAHEELITDILVPSVGHALLTHEKGESMH